MRTEIFKFHFGCLCVFCLTSLMYYGIIPCLCEKRTFG